MREKRNSSSTTSTRSPTRTPTRRTGRKELEAKVVEETGSSLPDADEVDMTDKFAPPSGKEDEMTLTCERGSAISVDQAPHCGRATSATPADARIDRTITPAGAPSQIQDRRGADRLRPVRSGRPARLSRRGRRVFFGVISVGEIGCPLPCGKAAQAPAAAVAQ